MRITNCLIFAVALIFALPAAADTTTIRLVCTVTQTSSGGARSDALPENELIKVSYAEDGKAIITRIDTEQDVREFPGEVTAEKILGEFHEYKSGPPSGPITRVEINRYTGDFLETTRYPSSASGDYQMADFKVFGTCKPASKQKF